MKRLILVFLVFLVASAAFAEPFGYKYLGSYLWVPDPGTAGTKMVSMSDLFGKPADLITVRSYLGSGGTDFRLRVILGNLEGSAGIDSVGGQTPLALPLSAAKFDTIITQGLGTDGLGATIVPASGQNFYGRVYWLAAPAATDTIIIDAYGLN